MEDEIIDNDMDNEDMSKRNKPKESKKECVTENTEEKENEEN